MNKQPEEPASSRRFMSLGGDMHLPPQKVGQQKFAPSNLNSSSFVPKVENPLVNQFPDIFTTCPELRKFQMPSLFSKSESNEEQDQNKNQNKPEEVQQREEPQPVQISQPRPFVFQRFQVIPFNFFTGFQPFAPIIKPHELGFVPKSEWPPQLCTLRDLQQMYFTRRNGISRRFDFKLYNALRITKAFPDAYPYIGAIWIGQNIMKIHSQRFAELLGIHAVQGGLFHKQGNFSRHGFVQVHKQSPESLALNINLWDVDDYNVRLFTDQQNRFSRDKEFDVSEIVGEKPDIVE